MNEFIARRLIAQAVGATGPIGTEKQFWTTVLTGLNGSFSSANNEHEFWRKFASHLKTKLTPLPANQAVVTNGDVIDATDGDFTITVANNVVTGGTWEAD
jgi:hypothetical protein